MKKLLSIVLVLCLALGMGVSAEAAEDIVEMDIQGNSVVVSSYEELQNAIANSEDGDTIEIADTIIIDGKTVKANCQITLARHESFDSGTMLLLLDNSGIDGFDIVDTFGSGCSVTLSTVNQNASVKNCTFTGGSKKENAFIDAGGSNAEIANCVFRDSIWYFVNCRSNSNCIFYNCSFSGSVNGAISVIGGTIELNDSIITDNYSFTSGAIYSSAGNVTINECVLSDNKVHGSEVGADIYSTQGSTLSIADNPKEGAGYYDRVSGCKITTPLVGYNEDILLVYLDDDVAKELFTPAPDDESNTPGGDGGDEDIPNEEPNIPEDDENEDEQIPGVVPPTEDGESAQQPEEPIPPTTGTDNDGDTSDNDQSDTERPEKPIEDDSNNGNDYTPSRPHKPVHRPSEPDTDIQQPEDPLAPELACGDAIIDTSRSVVLAGYGDGQLHEEDLLTRAQLATIIYRLLTDESISHYGKGQAIFDDVSAGAWYYQAVTTIGHAGIVSGVGGGQYDPDGLVTWAQAITVLSRFVEQQECELKHIIYTGWARPFIETAVSLGWIEDNHEFVPDALIKRGELVSLFNSVLGLYR